jgi:hypothetical protein
MISERIEFGPFVFLPSKLPILKKYQKLQNLFGIAIMKNITFYRHISGVYFSKF